MRGKSDHTKKRHIIDILMKRAMKGGKQAKNRLHKEFGIRVYSSEEVEEYVKERLKSEMIDESGPRVQSKNNKKSKSKKKKKLIAKKR
jgi:hypothetical protein